MQLGFGKLRTVRKWVLLLPLIAGILLFCGLIGSSLLLHLSSGHQRGSAMPKMEAKWVSKTDNLKIKAQILEQLRVNGTSPCHHMRTYSTDLVMISPDYSSKSADGRLIYYLEMNSPAFAFMLVSITENGTARCAGGDYYETELVGEHWRSRPAVTDNGNGSYSVNLVMDGDSPGVYNFTAYLLFDNFHGLDVDPVPWVVKKEVVRMQFEFRGAGSSQVRKVLPICKAGDMVMRGGGRWTREWYNETCEADKEGRYRCVGEDHEACDGRWCEGRVSKLESNGWVYSRERCRFHVWEEEETWNCLDGKWLVFWGDSNMQDMVRNLLLFVLDYPPPPGATVTDWYINPSLEHFFINPRRADQALHISIIPHNNLDHHNSLLNHTYRNWLHLHFNGSTESSTFPHFLIINPALDDGQYSSSVNTFISDLDLTFHFWHALLLQSLSAHHHHQHHDSPSIILRTAVTPAGDPRGKNTNPHKVEVFNSLTVERLESLQGGGGGNNLVVLDAFDLTFPFHFDYGCSDGGHYGRPPRYKAWPWMGEPHEYFVEVMLIHMMLNAMCNR